MAKNDPKKTAVNAAGASRLTSWDDFNQILGGPGGIGSRMGGAAGRADSTFGEAFSRYTDPNRGMSINPNASGWFDLPGGMGGGSSFNSTARGGFEEIARTGGINRADFDPAVNSYQNFINTGGLGQADIENIRYRATSQIPSFYESLENSLKRRRNVQGGYSPGFDAGMAELSRQSGRESYNASRMAEGDIVDRTMQGKMFGTKGSGDLATAINQMELQGKLAGLGGLSDIDKASASFSDAAAGRNLNAQLSLQDMYQKGGQFSASGLADLYRSKPGELTELFDLYLRGLGARGQTDQGYLGIQMGGKDDSNVWKNMASGATNALAAYYLGRV